MKIYLRKKTNKDFINFIQIFFDLVRQINKRTPVNKDKKLKGKNYNQSGNANPSSSSGKSGMNGLEPNSPIQGTNGNKQDCCVLL